MATIAINELGRRIGEDHHNAKLTDNEVELMRELHAEKAMGYRKLAQKFEVAACTVRNIVKYKTRSQMPSEWRVIKTGE
jgi:hypothetical protein